MFEAAVCDHLQLSDVPFVDCQALLALKTALETAARADVLQAPHHSLPTAGGADATATRRLPVSQPTLFHPPQARPQFQMLPQEIQERTIRLLARLLRLHVDQTPGLGDAREAHHE